MSKYTISVLAYSDVTPEELQYAIRGLCYYSEVLPEGSQ
jgi:hypothetical protein